MNYLHKYGYVTLPIKEIINKSNKEKSYRRKAVALTFDDGYENFFTLAYPILRDYGFTATVFVISKMIYGKNDLKRNADNNFLTWEQIEALRQNGISFESHTCSHIRLPSLSHKEIWHELVDSKKILETAFSEDIELLSYPYGANTFEIQEMAKAAGYKAAVGTSCGRSGRYNIWRRTCLRDDSLSKFVLKLSRLYHFPGYIKEETAMGRLIREIKHRVYR